MLDISSVVNSAENYSLSISAFSPGLSRVLPLTLSGAISELSHFLLFTKNIESLAVFVVLGYHVVNMGPSL